VLTRALEIGVTCIAAHCGTGTMLIDPDYFDVFVEMTRRFPRLYGDNSALASVTCRLRPSALRRMLEPPLAGRIPPWQRRADPVTGAMMWALGLISRREWRATARLSNPIERDAQLKRALGFSEETFTRLAGLLRQRVGRVALNAPAVTCR